MGKCVKTTKTVSHITYSEYITCPFVNIQRDIIQFSQVLILTRQLSYRKDDRAMRPIYGCPEKFRESSLRTRLLIAKFVMGFCSDRYQECAYKIRNS